MIERTDHSDDIAELRRQAGNPAFLDQDRQDLLRLCADLLELHDQTGVSLDNWDEARRPVERLIGHPITPNEA